MALLEDGSNPTNEPEKLDPEKLLDIYKYADTIMHSRVQSFLLTQTFFVLAYATVFAPMLAANSTLRLGGLMFLACICVVGILTAYMQMNKMLIIHAKISSLRAELESRHNEFRFYINGSRLLREHKYEYTKYTPMLIICLWVVLLFGSSWLSNNLASQP